MGRMQCRTCGTGILSRPRDEIMALSAGEGLLDRGSGDGMEGSVRFSVDSTVRSGVDGSVRTAGAPLKSALKSSTSKRPVQKTALQQSAGLREPQR